MDYSSEIVNLFDRVLKRQVPRVNPISLTTAMRKVERYGASVLDFNDAAHRYTYVYKYAKLYTGLVCEVLTKAFQTSSMKEEVSSKESLNVCCLSGGPGTDIVALLLILHEGLKECSVSVIDDVKEWAHLFESIVYEMKSHYGCFSDVLAPARFKYNYVDTSKSPISNQEVFAAVAQADIVTMVNLISTTESAQARVVVQSVFERMKPGAMILFIDNDTRGFYEMLQKVANKCGLQSVFGPLQHYEFEFKDPLFHQRKYNYSTERKTKVTAGVWKKKLPPPVVASAADETMNISTVIWYIVWFIWYIIWYIWFIGSWCWKKITWLRSNIPMKTTMFEPLKPKCFTV